MIAPRGRTLFQSTRQIRPSRSLEPSARAGVSSSHCWHLSARSARWPSSRCSHLCTWQHRRMNRDGSRSELDGSQSRWQSINQSINLSGGLISMAVNHSILSNPPDDHQGDRSKLSGQPSASSHAPSEGERETRSGRCHSPADLPYAAWRGTHAAERAPAQFVPAMSRDPEGTTRVKRVDAVLGDVTPRASEPLLHRCS